MYLYAQKTRNPVVNAVAETNVRSFGGGVYVYTIKFKQKTRNPVVNAVLTLAQTVAGGLELWPVGETRRRCGRPVREEGGGVV